jgi:hypothetical protein
MTANKVLMNMQQVKLVVMRVIYNAGDGLLPCFVRSALYS